MATPLASSLLRVRSGPNAGRTYMFRRTLRLGRHPYNEISIGDQLVSRYHCWIKSQEDGDVVIEDLKSGNGTFVNGERVWSQHPLKEGDLIRIGATEFTFTEAA